jgi:predicted nicotinamide N-methyase
MSHTGHWQPPTSSLPPVRALRSTPEDKIDPALRNLRAIYCPLRLPSAISQGRLKEASIIPELVDSGYASEDEEDKKHDTSGSCDALEALRADVFEQEHAVRWLTTLIARADELSFASEETRERIIEEAASLLTSFHDPQDEAVPEALTRDFAFPTSLASPKTIDVRLNDAPLSDTDHTDVGLQSWGASIIFSGLMCESPARFGLDKLQPGSSIMELGAGTGLVSLTLAALLPHISARASSIVATDYHPAVLDNLCTNIAVNFPHYAEPPVQTMLLDWSSPSLPSTPIDVLFAADVVYSPDHARMLRDCAARLLAPDGVFWLVVTVRVVGKFEGIADTVEAAFAPSECVRREDGKIFKILETDWLEKQRGVGRGDETGYRMYRIGWADR